MNAEPKWISSALSRARFEPYRTATGGDLARATRLYWWNVDVSASFYPLLHCLEVTTRNMMHTCLSTRFGQVEWWDTAPLRDNGVRMVADARSKVAQRRNGSAGSPDDLITELGFGFWESLISRAYDRDLWVPCLHLAFPGYRGKRAPLHGYLRTMRLFRNRIMHHEPIHHRHLKADHQTIHRVLSYLCPDIITQLAPFDRVPKLLAERP